jgi:hypothetical protein
MYLSASATCNHIAEGLRVLEPGGRMVIHGVPMRSPRVGSWSTFRRSFFVRTIGGGLTFLPSCTGRIGTLVQGVTFPTENFAVYPSPFMTVVIERNSAPFPCTLLNEWDHTGGKVAFLEAERTRRGDTTASDEQWSLHRLQCLLEGKVLPC